MSLFHHEPPVPDPVAALPDMVGTVGLTRVCRRLAEMVDEMAAVAVIMQRHERGRVLKRLARRLRTACEELED